MLFQKLPQLPSSTALTSFPRQRNRQQLHLDTLPVPPLRQQLRPPNLPRHKRRQLLRPLRHRRRLLLFNHVKLHRLRHDRYHHCRPLRHHHRHRQRHCDHYHAQRWHGYCPATQHHIQQPDAEYRYWNEDNRRRGCWDTNQFGGWVWIEYRCKCEREPDGWSEPDGGKFAGVGVVRGCGNVGAELERSVGYDALCV